jgi:hypothetical protein
MQPVDNNGVLLNLPLPPVSGAANGCAVGVQSVEVQA